MPPTDRTDQLRQIPLQHLLPDLLRQFNKPTLLGKHGIEVSKIMMDSIAEAVANREALPDIVAEINEAMSQIVQESMDDLKSRFEMSFAESLSKTDISDIGTWETTAEFLEIANHKNNAELRISAGTSLMVFLGDVRHADTLFTVIKHDNGLDDVDALIAKRALAHYTQIPLDSIDSDEWQKGVRQRLELS
ncbi:MAG: hypothetical protein Q9P44_02505 [Anaerolineae bacterium]|nr:hypothetical protein [Anaerolineae bacterium]